MTGSADRAKPPCDGRYLRRAAYKLPRGTDRWASSAGRGRGYVLKQVRGSGLLMAIRTVAAGRSLLDPTITRRMLDRIRRGADHRPNWWR